MPMHKLVVIVKRESSDGEEEFLLVRQSPPPLPSGDEYQKYVDSNLWDLPSAPLKLLDGGQSSQIVVGKTDLCLDKVDLGLFGVETAMEEALSQFSIDVGSVECWEYYKYVEDAEFGPGPLVHMVFVVGKLKGGGVKSQDFCMWISVHCAMKKLSLVKKNDDRIGPLMAMGLLYDSTVRSTKWEVPSGLHFQEYPPGVTIVPMRSRTQKPFWTTNLVVVAQSGVRKDFGDSEFIAYGDSLVMDPGCCSDVHHQLEEIVTSLPRKLIVFVTHHHYDHIDGLSLIKRCNPDAVLLAHKNTMSRIGKDICPLHFVPVSGGERICIGDQHLEVIFSPGHTDGHMALLHTKTNSLVVGDHCVGQGSAVLDVTSGGNMKDFFQTSYNFMELSPHVIIPMHGRLNLWPKQMLCGYIKHRRDRELSILKAIESGATTLFDILSISYAEVDTRLWIGASSNVRVHVDYLAYQEKLPKDFSVQKFQKSCLLPFLSRWAWRHLINAIIGQKSTCLKLFLVIGFAGFAMSCSVVRHPVT